MVAHSNYLMNFASFGVLPFYQCPGCPILHRNEGVNISHNACLTNLHNIYIN